MSRNETGIWNERTEEWENSCAAIQNEYGSQLRDKIASNTQIDEDII